MSDRASTTSIDEDVVSHRTTHGGGAMLLATPFAAVGAWLALAGFGVVPFPGEANAPLAVIGWFGVAFFIAGATFFVNGARGALRAGRKRALDELFRDEPWHGDFDWDPTEAHDPWLRRLGGMIVGIAVFGAFLVPFHWWAWRSPDESLFVRVFVSIFELFFLLALATFAHRLARGVKYGGSRLRFARFPFHPGDAMTVTFAPNRFDELVAELRFVEERWVTTGRSGERTTRLVVESIWSETRVLTPSRRDPEVEIRFELPDRLDLVDQMSRSPVRYWELVLSADVPGVDFHATFKLPVYRSRAQEATFRSAAVASIA